MYNLFFSYYPFRRPFALGNVSTIIMRCFDDRRSTVRPTAERSHALSAYTAVSVQYGFTMDGRGSSPQIRTRSIYDVLGNVVQKTNRQRIEIHSFDWQTERINLPSRRILFKASSRCFKYTTANDYLCSRVSEKID